MSTDSGAPPSEHNAPAGRARRLALGAAATLLLLAIIYWREPLWALFTNQARVRARIASLGAWAPLGGVLFVAVKVLFAPIPGQIIGTVNGYLFGTLLGTVYSMIGVTLGTLLAMSIGRYAGRPVVARLIGPANLARWDDLAQRRGLVFFLLIYLLPFTPDDVVSYVAGMTSLRFMQVLLWGTLARLPGMIVGNWFGSAAPQFTSWQWALVGLYVVGWIALTIRYYNRLEAATLRLISRVEAWRSHLRPRSKQAKA